MKRTLKTGALALALTLTLAGCGQENQKKDANQQATTNNAVANNAQNNAAKQNVNHEAEGTNAATESAPVDTDDEFDVAKYKEGMEEIKKVNDDDAKGTIYKKADKDGEYYLYEGDADEHGWSTVAAITTKDGKVIFSYFNYIDKDGKLKTDDQEYLKQMKEQANNDMEKTIAYFQDVLMKPKTDDLDPSVVSGATNSTSEFEEIADELYDAAGIED